MSGIIKFIGYCYKFTFSFFFSHRVRHIGSSWKIYCKWFLKPSLPPPSSSSSSFYVYKKRGVRKTMRKKIKFLLFERYYKQLSRFTQFSCNNFPYLCASKLSYKIILFFSDIRRIYQFSVPSCHNFSFCHHYAST